MRPVQHAATSPFRGGLLRVLLGTFMSVVLFFGSSAWFVYQSIAHQVRESALDISSLGNPDSQSGEEEKLQLIDHFEGQAINILISGVDSRYNQSDTGIGSAEELTTIQSDTTMIAHISADRTAVTVVSIPRDLITDIPSCIRADGSRSWEYQGMFNSAFSTGAVTDDLAGGIACTKAAAEELTGLHIDAFVVVDFAGFRGMINALGGVWFDVEEDMYDEAAGLNISAGCQRFDAQTALAFARARKEVGDGSDTSRIGRQQQLVSAMLRELLSKNFLTDFPALLSFVQATIASLTYSPNLADIKADSGLLYSLLNLEKENIRFVTMPWVPSPSDPNRVLEMEPMASRLWLSLQEDTSLPIGIDYTDGMGVMRTVTDPSESDQAQSELSPETESNDQGEPAPVNEASTEPPPPSVSTCPPVP